MKPSVLTCPSCGAVAETPAGPEPRPCKYCKSALHPSRCPWCFTWCFTKTGECPGCHACLDPVEGPVLSCPTCRGYLNGRSLGNIRIDGCMKCGGMWVAPDAFARLCSDRAAQAAYLGEGSVLPAPKTHDPTGQSGPMYRPCAACSDMMNRVNFAGASGVVIDACKPHGLWFDMEELARIVAFVKAGGLDQARERELRRLIEEQRRLRLAGSLPELPTGPDERVSVPAFMAMAAARGVLDLLGRK